MLSENRHICLVDDEKNIRRLVAYDLRSANYEVSAFENGQEVWEASQHQDFDAYVIDWMMPVLDGLSLVKRLRAQNNTKLIIMLTAKAQEEDLIEAFEAGVDDYMIKPFSSRELLIRLKTHLNRLSNTALPLLQFGELVINSLRREVKFKESILNFTKVEYDLLELLISQKGMVFSRDEILNRLWGFEYDGDTRIVDVHISKLRSKLSQTSLEIVSLRGVGYRCEMRA